MRISIITLTVDDVPYLEEAIDSIEQGELFEIEHIVVHDGDRDFIATLELRHPATAVMTGPGAGATAAAAVGVQAASGDFIILLHSDDRLCGGALSRLTVAAAARPDIKIWSGGARIFRKLADGGETVVRAIIRRDLTRLSLENICDDVPLLSARFCHRSVFAEIGNFDPKFSESSDREFLLRAAMAHVPEAPLDVVVSEMRLHEGSRTIHRRRRWVPPYLAEHIQVAEMWLARADVDGGARRFLRNWRAREILRLAYYRLRAGQWTSAAALLLRAERIDLLWIFHMLTVFMGRRRRLRHDNRSIETGLRELAPSSSGDRNHP
jgi:glycosyltransferase involved in cell wall biosynthesis